MNNKNSKVNLMTQGALLAALCYIGFQFLRIDIALPGGDKTAIHLGNAFCVLAALLLNNPYGYLAGAVGMTIADLTSGYATSAPKTFVLKLCIALIVTLVAHKLAHIEAHNDKGYRFKWSLIASIAGMAFNVVADPLVGYAYKRYLLGVTADLAAALAKIATLATFVNAVTAVVIATLLYCVLRPILEKSGFVKSLN
jgi:uncharacterized membrane protein